MWGVEGVTYEIFYDYWYDLDYTSQWVFSPDETFKKDESVISQVGQKKKTNLIVEP